MDNKNAGGGWGSIQPSIGKGNIRLKQVVQWALIPCVYGTMGPRPPRHHVPCHLSTYVALSVLWCHPLKSPTPDSAIPLGPHD